MNEIEDGRGAGDSFEDRLTLFRCLLGIGGFNWHRVNLFCADRRAIEQAFAKMREIPARIYGGRHAFIYGTMCTLFHGTSLAANARNMIQGVRPPLTAISKRSARGHGCASFSGDCFGCGLSGAFVGCEDFGLHYAAQARVTINGSVPCLYLCGHPHQFPTL